MSIISIILLFFLLQIISSILINKSIVNNTISMCINKIYDLAETGDIIYFRWHTMDIDHEIISPFTHIGMIIVIGNIKYIIETHLAGDTSNIGVLTGGVNLYPLKLRINNYEGYTFLSKLNQINRPTDINVQDFITKIKDYKQNIPFQNDYKGYFINNCLAKRVLSIEPEKTQEMFCSEFIGFCLNELNITNNDFNFKCLVPIDFRYIKLNNQLLYRDLIKIIKSNNLNNLNNL